MMMAEQLGFAPEGATVNQHVFFQEVLGRLSSRVKRVRRNLWEANNWVLQHDNAPSHSAISFKQFLAEKRVALLDHLPYSLDLDPCDFWPFPKVKNIVKRAHFESVEDLQTRVTNVLKSLKTEAFEGCFRAWREMMY